MSLSGLRVLVTGAASGIGRACCARAVAEGALVAGLDVNGELLAEVADEIGILALIADVTDESAVAAALDSATASWGSGPDAVINAAGVYRIEGSSTLSRSAWDDVLAINLTGSLLVAQQAARAMTGRGGSIVLLSSIAAERGDRFEPAAHYAASKGGVSSLARQLAVEWGPLGIRVNAVAPGVIDTPMLRLGDDPDRMRAYLDAAVPLGRLGRAEEVAAACCFLASPQSSYISGAVLPVDGGAGAA